jgi:prevent-host-death family protein
MLKIGAFEAKNTLGTLLDRVESGEEILITRHGRPIARLVPNTTRTDQSQVRAAIDRIQSRAIHLNLHFDWQQLKNDRDEGRP